ncbi:unnamed protein product, partial [Gulo gulo]
PSYLLDNPTRCCGDERKQCKQSRSDPELNPWKHSLADVPCAAQPVSVGKLGHGAWGSALLARRCSVRTPRAHHIDWRKSPAARREGRRKNGHCGEKDQLGQELPTFSSLDTLQPNT